MDIFLQSTKPSPKTPTGRIVTADSCFVSGRDKGLMYLALDCRVMVRGLSLCSPVHGILQARILEWAAIPCPGDLPDPGIEPRSAAL